jgi:hypothetical protein
MPAFSKTRAEARFSMSQHADARQTAPMAMGNDKTEVDTVVPLVEMDHADWVNLLIGRFNYVGTAGSVRPLAQAAPQKLTRFVFGFMRPPSDEADDTRITRIGAKQRARILQPWLSQQEARRRELKGWLGTTCHGLRLSCLRPPQVFSGPAI